MKLLLPLFACASLWMGCASSKAGQSNQTAMLVHPASIQVTQQDVHPGAQGMVRKIRTYSVSGIADVRTPVTVHRLRVDSLQFPVKQLKLNGASASGLTLEEGAGTAFSFSATRLFTGEKKANPLGFGQGARLMNEQTLESSGVLLDGTAQLVLLSGTDTVVVDLGTIEVLPEVYAP